MPTPSELRLEDPLFQLNLVLFLSIETPPEYLVPIFYQEGFSIKAISPTIPFNP
jgi:hypothetical protein